MNQKTPKQWAVDNGIDDTEALERVKLSMQILNGNILSVDQIKPGVHKFDELPRAYIEHN